MYTILVNSSDGFSDCWDPFFSLFKKYWPDCNNPIVLNTEFKTYQSTDLAIKSSQVNKGKNSHLTWSECLIETLKRIDTSLVLYFQEDYFIERDVNVKTINDFAALMLKDSTIKFIGLTDCCNYQPFKKWAGDNRLWEMSKHTKYRISTQCGLWDKNTLLSYLRPEENGWMFEIFGTERAKRRDELFLTINRELFNSGNPIVYYQETGIRKGKWLDTMPALFEKESIFMDFSKRGLYKEPNTILRRFETFRKLLINPVRLFKGLSGY